MRKVIASIDIGSDSVKLVVGEFIGTRLHVLSASKTEVGGIKACQIVDKDKVVASVKKVLEDSYRTLGVPIKRVLLGVNIPKAKLVKSLGTAVIKTEGGIITGDDVSGAIDKCADGKVDEGYSLIEVLPVEFSLADGKIVRDPKGEKSEKLYLKGIVITAPKEFMTPYLRVVEEAGCSVVDIIPNCLGDYETFANKVSSSSIGAIVDLGSETTSISIFNRGILTNTKACKMGVLNILKDISFIYKTDESTSRALYKDLALASSKLANPTEVEIIETSEGKKVKINQHELAEIAESRIVEILNLAKKQINILTKKEISYIIITGGLTELKDFRITLESVFGKNVYIGNLNIIGVRDNSFAASVGIIKFFDKKLALRGKTFSIFNGSELEEISTGSGEIDVDNASSNSLLNKVFGYFFDS